jgi:hypothetical protein
MFARLLSKLQATPDGDGTLLDHVTMMYGAGIADSNSHSPIDIPMILAGAAAPGISRGDGTCGSRTCRWPTCT